MLADDRILFFNNGNGSEPSLVIELTLDFDARTVAREWWYDGEVTNAVMGDVQRLENGNTLITYSLAGEVHEVDPSGNVVETMNWGLGAAVGYSTKRTTLYGAPPR